MKHALIPALLCAATLTPSALLLAQDDGRIVFTDPKSKDSRVMSEEDLRPRTHTWGANIFLGDDGFGLGFFFTQAFNDDLSAVADLSFSEAKDSRQIDLIDYWGVPYSPNKVNRIFRIPLFFGLQYRLFKDEIVDNFRPYVNAAAGPVMLYVTPASEEFFTSLGHGAARYTYGGFAGVGAQFGFDRTSVLGVNVRYFLIPVPAGIPSVEGRDLNNANGFFISLNLGVSF
jgi:hypothetical protein